MLLPLDEIVVDPGVQARTCLRQDRVGEYAAAMRDGDVFPPVVVFGRVLADGFYRLAAARKAKLKSVEADVREGGRREAILYAVGADDSHGLSRNPGDKRRAVCMLLEDPEWSRWSDREI